MRGFFILLLLFIYSSVLAGDSWQKILEEGKGIAYFYWFPNNVNISNSKDVIDGVEHDLAFAFIDYLNDKYNIEIEVQWIESSSFGEVMQTVRNESGGVFGASSISVTQERSAYLNFTPPYIADIAVLVSSPQLPIAYTPNEFKEIFEGRSAITIQNTTLFDALQDLKDELSIEFEMNYVDNSGQVIEKIEGTNGGFGYIDLPNFMVAVKNSSLIRRQFFYPIKLEGLAMIYPKGSDWEEPVNDYFGSEQFEIDKKEIILRYFGEDISNMIERISKSAEIGPLEEIVISNREKELQYEELLQAAAREHEENRFNNVLFIAAGFGGLGLFFLIVNVRIKARTNQVLIEQQKTIEERNEQLNQLNEEKNDLIKILAHDLRSPLSNIVGSTTVLAQSDKLDDSTKQMVEFISQASERIKSMIEKILDVDAIESGERNMKIESISARTVVEEVVENNQKRAENKKIVLTSLLEATPNIEADQFYLTQVIENLVSNAIKFSESDKEVNLKVKTYGGMVRISVKDEGPGFSKEDQKKIFRRFHKLSAKPTAGEETVGLGLSIVKSYTEMMGGNVSFKTEEGKGTVFHVDLQMAD